MGTTPHQDRSQALRHNERFREIPDRIQDWILASANATRAFSDFFDRQGKFQLEPGNSLPRYSSAVSPSIWVSAEQWRSLQEPGSSEYAQRHLFGTLAHEIGHDRYNTGNVLFPGGSADDYVRYRAGLEAQAIFTAFAIFKDLENEPAFKRDFPFNSIGYLNGIELATMYKQWRAGEQNDQAVVEQIAAKVPDTRYSLGNPPPDLSHDGAITHRDAYLRDYQQLIRQRPELAQPAPAPRADASNLSEPDRAMLEQIRGGARAALRMAHDEPALERVSRALLAECKDGRDRHPDGRYAHASNALHSADHVVLSTDGRNLFVVEGRLDDPAHKRAVVDLAQAAQTPVEQSDRKLETAHRHIAAERAQAPGLAQGPEAAPAAPAR